MYFTVSFKIWVMWRRLHFLQTKVLALSAVLCILRWWKRIVSKLPPLHVTVAVSVTRDSVLSFGFWVKTFLVRRLQSKHLVLLFFFFPNFLALRCLSHSLIWGSVTQNNFSAAFYKKCLQQSPQYLLESLRWYNVKIWVFSIGCSAFNNAKSKQ